MLREYLPGNRPVRARLLLRVRSTWLNADLIKSISCLSPESMIFSYLMEKNKKNTALGYLNHLSLMDDLKNYASPKSKLTTLIKSGEIIRIKRDLYLPGNESDYSVMTLANVIFGPSYISFETALSYYNLIPEKVHSVMSATYKKNKARIFKTPIGHFIYKYINPLVYPYGMTRMVEDDFVFLIANREKALCDSLSKIPGMASIQQLEALLFEDLRIEKRSLLSMDVNFISLMAPLYKKKTISLLDQYLKKRT